MAAHLETAKIALVTIIAAGELLEGLKQSLRGDGASGYTVSLAAGYGVHGSREMGFLDIGNVRIEILLSRDRAHELLRRLAEEYADRGLVAFLHDVEAVPKRHFS